MELIVLRYEKTVGDIPHIDCFVYNFFFLRGTDKLTLL